jgi:tetratricopeptide (TPR) repeat protein
MGKETGSLGTRFAAHHNLAAMLQAKGHFDDAVREYQTALRVYLDDAVVNNAMASALQEQPNDANAEANLGSALAELGKFAEAKSHFERALQIDPHHSLAKENLQELQRAMNQH